jgi:predicted permease
MHLYRLLLRIFPRGFRARFGGDMADVFADRRRAARRQGLPALTAFWIRATADSIAHGLAERRHHRPATGDALMLTLIQDVRFALRLMRRRPAFATATVLTLALGVGANVAIFSAVRIVLLSDLPYPDADRLVSVSLKTSIAPSGGMALSVAAFERLHQQTSVFEAIAATQSGRVVTLTGAGDPERIAVRLISPGFSRVAAMSPIEGRLFGPGDYVPGTNVLLISDRLWRSRFGGDQTIGRRVHLRDADWTIVGIVPDGFDIGATGDVLTDAWMPLVWSERDRDPSSGNFGLGVVARLAPGIDVSEANLRLDASVEAMPPGGSVSVRGVQLEPLAERYAGPLRPALLLLQGICALLLIIACANLTNLFLAHGSSRGREFGVRLAIGAGGRRLLRQIACEASVMAVFGAGAGLVLAYLVLPALVLMAPWSLAHRADEIAVRGPELAFALALSVMAALAAALVPATIASRTDPLASLRGTTHATPGRIQGLLREALVAAQVVFAIVLLTGAGLLIRSFAALVSEPLGFDPGGLIVTEVPLPGSYDPSRNQAAVRQLHDELRARFGRDVVAIGNSLPYGGSMMGPATPLLPSGTYGDFRSVPYRSVTADYFQVFGILLLRGRGFLPSDTRGSPLVVVVNEQFVQEFGGGRDLLGSAMRLGPRDVTVVGIAGNTRNSDLTGTRAAVYWSIEQRPISDLTVAVRAESVAAAVAGIRDVVRTIDPNLPLVRPQSMDQRIASTRVSRRFYLWMLSLLGVLGGTLTALGVYGVVTHATTQRTREIGIRSALGAGVAQVRRLVLSQGLRPVVVGVAGGLLGAWWITNVLQTNRVFAAQLYRIPPNDPHAFAAAALLLLIVATVACWIPALRASRIDPARTLRTD